MWWRLVMIRGLRSGICWIEGLFLGDLRGCRPIAETVILSLRSAHLDGLGFEGVQNISLCLKIQPKGRSAKSWLTMLMLSGFQ
jgi:hypothetical protein